MLGIVGTEKQLLNQLNVNKNMQNNQVVKVNMVMFL